jgi:esterase/lipase
MENQNDDKKILIKIIVIVIAIIVAGSLSYLVSKNKKSISVTPENVMETTAEKVISSEEKEVIKEMEKIAKEMEEMEKVTLKEAKELEEMVDPAETDQDSVDAPAAEVNNSVEDELLENDEANREAEAIEATESNE